MDVDQLPIHTHSTGILPHQVQAVTLLQLLSNTLILHQTVPYLPICSTLALGATSQSFQQLIHHTCSVFRHLDLRNVGCLELAGLRNIFSWDRVWKARREGNADLYSRPLQEAVGQSLRGRNILKDVRSLVLDGQRVSADVLGEIILDPSYNVQLLSIRGVRDLNETQLIQVLRYAVQPARPENTPRLKGVYLFGSMDSSTPRQFRVESSDSAGLKRTVAATIGASWNQESSDQLSQSLYGTSEKWYRKSGRMTKTTPLSEWGQVLVECKDIISFDAPLCAGPRHTLPTQFKGGKRKSGPWYSAEEFHIAPRVATFALGGCHSCGKAPEGLARYGEHPTERFPLLAPVPLHQSTIRAAKTPKGSTTPSLQPHILARCQECLQNRYCDSCHKWWCEDCYDISSKDHVLYYSQTLTITHSRLIIKKQLSQNAGLDSNDVKGVTRECWDCGLSCFECSQLTQQSCKVCGGGYCTIHNEGSTLTTCDWCSTGRNRHFELY